MGSDDDIGKDSPGGDSLKQQIEELLQGRRKPANLREFVDQKMAEDAREKTGDIPGDVEANDDK